VPTGGTAVVAGIDVVADPARARQRFGVVSQANTLDRGLTVQENLSLHARYFGMSRRVARQAADAWLDVFRLGHKAKAMVGELSGGMQRRLMLARALVHGPDVVFLDEPTAGLDPQSRAALWEVVQSLHAAGRTIVLTTHYIEEAEEFSDRVAIMDHGEILALDTPAALRRTMGTGVTITVRADGDMERLAGRLRHVEGATGVVPRDGTVRLHLAEPDGALATVLRAAERGGFRLTDISASEDSLETVFISLTGRELRD
jgi:ABC-2 type transport system ATP-binding protein